MFSLITKVSLFSLFFLLSQSLWAKDSIKLSVKLDAIEKMQAQESGGDELYFSITEYSSRTHPRHYVVPDFPMHWLSAYLNQVRDVTLWEKELNNNEAVQVIFSLVERDVPPWNIDDLFGSVKLKVKFKDDKVTQEWSIPNSENTAKISDQMNAFSFVGDHAEYHLVLRLVESKAD